MSTYFTIGDKDRTVENFKRQLEFLKKVGGQDIVVAVHEAFHALTIAAFTAHYTAILLAAT